MKVKILTGLVVFHLAAVSFVYAEKPEVNIGGLIEVGYEKIGDDPGNLRVGDIEVSIDAKLNENISGNILLRPDTPDEILDETTISLETAPISITAGKTVMPFGVFESHLISDPWTKENEILVWETNQVGVIGAYSKPPVEISLALYDSTKDEEPVSFALQVSLTPVEEITIRGSYRNQKGEDGVGTNTLTDIGAYFQFASGPVTVDIEYCGATTREKNEPKPSAYSIGLSYQVSEPLEFALRYDSLNDDDDNIILPKSRIGVGMNYTLFDAAIISVEVGSTKPEKGGSKTDYAAKLVVKF
jgi:hypothetical protein